MTAVTWIWAHGASGCVDFPADFQEFAGPPAQVPLRPITRGAEGLSLSPLLASTHLICLPIASTPLLDDVFMRVASIVLLYRATDAVVDSVALFDGAKQIASFASLGWSGAHQSRDSSNTLNLPSEVEFTSALVAVITATFSQSPNPRTGALTGSLLVTAAGIKLSAGETRLQRWFRNIGSVFQGQ